MSLLRTSFLRSSPRTIVRSATPTTSLSARRFASSDYGSGSGDPKGENPQSQGANPSADKEHPGPPPPKAGEGSGSTPTKGTSTGHNTGEAKGGNNQQKKSFSTFSRRMASQDENKSQQGAQPKILNRDAPKKEEQSEDVKKHNQEMDQRAEQTHEKADDGKDQKVGKEFWSGHGGADREP